MTRLVVARCVLPSALPSRPRVLGRRDRDWGASATTPRASSSSPDAAITAANVAKLRRRRVELDGTVDSVADLSVGGTASSSRRRTGKTEALDAASGRVLWRFTPPAYASLAGSAQITNATPAASTDGAAVYAAAPDGRDPQAPPLRTGRCCGRRAITRDPTHEKITSSLNVSRGLVIATTGGYIGDAPPYQGHVVTMSERHRPDRARLELALLRPARVDPAAHVRLERLGDLVAERRRGRSRERRRSSSRPGTAPFNGRTDWGDSVLVLDAGRVDGCFATGRRPNQAQLNVTDVDLGSTSPALLAGGYAVQGGKDGKLRLLAAAPPAAA